MDEDELFRLRIMQSFIDTARAVRAHRPWSEARQSQARGMAELNRISSSPACRALLVSMIFDSQFSPGPTNPALRCETEWQY